jgi:hypothetical protein
MNNKELEDLVYNYPTKYEEGFTGREIIALSEHLGIAYEKVWDKIGVVTCGVRGGQAVIYHCDVLTGVRCTLENRDMTLEEWD